jgi:hypothetical protein
MLGMKTLTLKFYLKSTSCHKQIKSQQRQHHTDWCFHTSMRYQMITARSRIHTLQEAKLVLTPWRNWCIILHINDNDWFETA